MAGHRGNVARLPLPPRPMGDARNAMKDVQALYEHLSLMTTILNQGLQSLQNRQNTVQQTGATVPPTVTGLTVTGKQGCFWLTWNRIKNVDGYVVVQASDTAMSQLIGRFPVPDGDSCTLSIAVGNAAVTSSFQVYAYQGKKYSEPSAVVTATTVAFGAGEAAPPTPPLAPRQPKLAPIRSGPNL